MKLCAKYLSFGQAGLSLTVGIMCLAVGGILHHSTRWFSAVMLMSGAMLIMLSLIWSFLFREKWWVISSGPKKDEPPTTYWMNKYFSFGTGMIITDGLMSVVGGFGYYLLVEQRGILFYVILSAFICSALLCLTQLVILGLEYTQNVTEDDHDSDYPSKSIHEDIHEELSGEDLDTELKQWNILYPEKYPEYIQERKWEPWPLQALTFKPFYVITTTLNNQNALTRIERAEVAEPICAIAGGHIMTRVVTASALNTFWIERVNKSEPMTHMVLSLLLKEVAPDINLDLSNPDLCTTKAKYCVTLTINQNLFVAFGEDGSNKSIVFRADSTVIPDEKIPEINKFIKENGGL